MSLDSPILDQPQIVDFDRLPAGAINRLANLEIECLVDANSDLLAFAWPWAAAGYMRSIRVTISDIQDGVLMPLAVRFFPGHQETIAGAEGMIVTKRLIVPQRSPEDRALLWLLECQAEGDRLLRLEVEIDWGQPLTQRLVDGLLVAQHNPEPARGIYAQSNAESTRIFGNSQGHPDVVDLSDPARAQLVYHVLVNGIVEVPLLLTVSDVGEQVAWNSFLSLRDVEQIFGATSEAWNRLLRSGRLWTPDPRFNRAVEIAKLTALRHVQRLRGGLAPTQRKLVTLPPLVRAWDVLDPVVSHNLLAHVRRLAEQTAGQLPAQLPGYAEPALVPEASAPAPTDLVPTAGAYLRALRGHLERQGEEGLLAEHYPAVRLCAEALVRQRRHAADDAVDALFAAAFADAIALARAAADQVNAARWESELDDLSGKAGQPVPPAAGAAAFPQDWAQVYGWQPPADLPWQFTDPWRGIQLVGDALWEGAGVHRRGGAIMVEPGWQEPWTWWALLNLPIGGQFLSLLWDGSVLHATLPVQSRLPVQLQKRIQLLHSDEFDFAPYFELTSASDSGDTSPTKRFKPVFVQR